MAVTCVIDVVVMVLPASIQRTRHNRSAHDRNSVYRLKFWVEVSGSSYVFCRSFLGHESALKSGQVEIMFKQHGSFSNTPWGVDLCVICEHVPVVS